MSKRISISISIDKDIDLFLRKCTNEVIDIGGHKIETTKTKNELYNECLKYGLKHANEWLFDKDGQD